MRTRTSGIQVTPGGERSVDKRHCGIRIFERLGKVSQDEAEKWLRNKQSEIELEIEKKRSGCNSRMFADGCGKYLEECLAKNVKTTELIGYHVKLLLPYVGQMQLDEVCSESFEEFIADRLESGASPTTVNRSLEVARTILNRAARVWRSGGKPWISTSPLIETLDENRRKPRPISWSEEILLCKHLPEHLLRMVKFTLNTGCRDENVCGLKWEWERHIKEIGRSVFVIPEDATKMGRAHVVILNDVAWGVVQACRGMDKEYVFVYRHERVKNTELEPRMAYHRVGTMNNTAYQGARRKAGISGVRVHDLRHTFGSRLRDAGVSEEDRSLLLGHVTTSMAQHYAAATIERLVDVANSVRNTKDRTTLLRVVNG